MEVPEYAMEARSLDLSWDGGATLVAKDVSILLAHGETVCVVGRSGCGKTTLLHALSGLSVPISGRVIVGGVDVTGSPGQVSYMLQKDLLLPNLTIIDNVCLPLTIKGVKRAEARERAATLFDRFGLTGTERKWPSQLSGGMRQRAAFLRTYMMGNDVVLLDEPFSALDALTRSDLRDWYAQTASELGLSSIIITHDVEEAQVMADRVYALVGKPAHAVEVEPNHEAIIAALGL